MLLCPKIYSIKLKVSYEETEHTKGISKSIVNHMTHMLNKRSYKSEEIYKNRQDDTKTNMLSSEK